MRCLMISKYELVETILFYDRPLIDIIEVEGFLYLRYYITPDEVYAVNRFDEDVLNHLNGSDVQNCFSAVKISKPEKDFLMETADREEICLNNLLNDISRERFFISDMNMLKIFNLGILTELPRYWSNK